jgi:hypothetical protein
MDAIWERQQIRVRRSDFFLLAFFVAWKSHFGSGGCGLTQKPQHSVDGAFLGRCTVLNNGVLAAFVTAMFQLR